MYIFKKKFIISFKNGLCNQLILLAKAIIIGHIFNRDLIFNGFQVDYQGSDYWPLDSVVNINKLQQFLINNKIYVTLFTNFIYDKNNNRNGKNSKNRKNYKILEKDNPFLIDEINKNLDYQFLDCQTIFPAHIPDIYYKLFEHILINIDFVDFFHEKVAKIKNVLCLKNYNCVHLRMEDDIIHFMKQDFNYDNDFTNKYYKGLYNEELEKMVGQKVFICTGLGLSENMNNNYYEEIKNKYNLVDKHQYMDNFYKYRELHAIIDLIIAKESDYFVGGNISTFSYVVILHFNSKNKNFKQLKTYLGVNDS